MTTPRFSVLLPTRNRIDLLEEAIETVRAQDYADWEIIVSDNASAEDVRGLVERIGDPRIIYLRSDTPLPVTANWNRAMDAARGHNVVMLGDDDGLTPGYFTAMIAHSAALGEPEVIYHGAYHFAFPGVLPGQPQGSVHDVTALFPILNHSTGPALLDPAKAHAAARAALDMRALYGFNMQYFLFRRDFLDRLREFGPVFRGPYPDFYTANLALLLAPRIGVVPSPMTIIGITPKSYGYFHFNDAEAAGVDFLQNQDFRRDVPQDLLARLLPGSYMNTLWLVSVALIQVALPGDSSLRLGVARYRMLQVLDAVLRVFTTGRRWDGALAPLWPLLSGWEKARAGVLRGLLSAAGRLPRRLRDGIARRLVHWAGQYGGVAPAARKLPLTPARMPDVFAGLQAITRSTN
jgi:glycosyltransferase involved in cell wall biosynthesis